MTTVYIYGLVDPRDGLIHYIGQTEKMSRRIQQHRKRDDKTVKHKWISGLQKLGLNPYMKVLEITDSNNCQQKEKEWIQFGVSEKWPLTNATGGGEGNSDSMKAIRLYYALEELGFNLRISIDNFRLLDLRCKAEFLATVICERTSASYDSIPSPDKWIKDHNLL